MVNLCISTTTEDNKIKSVKDNEGGVKNEHVSHSKAQNCDANSCTVWLKNYVLSSLDKCPNMVEDMCYTIL
jgi:hypothetical protein